MYMYMKVCDCMQSEEGDEYRLLQVVLSDGAIMIVAEAIVMTFDNFTIVHFPIIDLLILGRHVFPLRSELSKNLHSTCV